MRLPSYSLQSSTMDTSPLEAGLAAPMDKKVAGMQATAVRGYSP